MVISSRGSISAQLPALVKQISATMKVGHLQNLVKNARTIRRSLEA